jgi:uncharacterized protein (TIGR00156 family)
MKRFLWICIIAAFAVTGLVAQDGYRGPGAEVITVEKARTLRDDSPVILRGNIVRSYGSEKYQFADETGSIDIEIDDWLWRGLSVDQNDRVEITGTIDRERSRIEVEVESIKKL